MKIRPSSGKLFKSICWGFRGINSQGETWLIWSFSQTQMSLLDSAFSLPILVYHAFPAAALAGNAFGCYFHSLQGFQIKTQRYHPHLHYGTQCPATIFIHCLVSIQQDILISANELLIFPLC